MNNEMMNEQFDEILALTSEMEAVSLAETLPEVKKQGPLQDPLNLDSIFGLQTPIRGMPAGVAFPVHKTSKKPLTPVRNVIPREQPVPTETSLEMKLSMLPLAVALLSLPALGCLLLWLMESL